MSAAYSYLRVSGHAQKIGDGPDRQRDSIAKYAAAHDLTIAHEYPDLGVSGTTDWDHREQFVAMVKAIEADGVRIVLVERADRLARDLMVNEVLLGKLRDLGVRVIETDSGNELTAGDDDPTRVLIRHVLGAVAQFNKTLYNHQLKAGRDRIRHNGRSNNPADKKADGDRRFGAPVSKRQAHKPEAVERANGEALTLARIRELHDGGYGPNSIANLLNAESIPTRKGRPWSRFTVSKILKRSV